MNIGRLYFVPVPLLLTGQFVLLGAMWPVIPVDPDLSMRYAIVCVLAAFLLNLLYGMRSGIRVLLLGLGFALTTALVPILAKGYDSFLLATLLSAMLGYLAYRYPPRPVLIIWLLGGMILYLFVYYWRHGQLNDVFYFETIDGQAGVSRNYVGILMLQQYLVYYALCIRTSTRIQHWPLFLMPVLTIMSSGVGSTLVAILALGGYLILRFALRPLYGLLLFFIVLVVIFGMLSWIESTRLFERLTGGEFIISRLLLWSDFASRLDARSILLGFPYDAEFVDHEVSLNLIHNLHNSYLNIFKRIGIFALPYYLLVLYTLAALLRRNSMLGWLFICALLRAATDGYFYSTFLVDFLLFFLFMLTPAGERLLRLPTVPKTVTNS